MGPQVQILPRIIMRIIMTIIQLNVHNMTHYSLQLDRRVFKDPNEKATPKGPYRSLVEGAAIP